MNDPKGRQAGFNAASRDQWNAFSAHRQTVSALLGAGSRSIEGRLCVLGAGNCNDLDLSALLSAHREVCLVDLDSEALARGAERQGVGDHPRLKRVGGLDLTAGLDAFASWSPQAVVRPEAVAALAEEPARRIGPMLGGPFEIVASTCLLSQLIGNAFHSVGERHPQFLPLVQSIRAGHLRLLTHLTAPGGSAILVTDVVSSDTFRTLASVDEESLPDLLTQLVRQRNFFHGVSPAVLATVFKNDPVLSARVAAVETVKPWRWNLHERVYLVWALRCRIVSG